MLKRIVFLMVGIVLALTAGSALSQTINKPTVQFFLQVHKGYRGDPETWGWTPMINFRVNGLFGQGGALSVEYIDSQTLSGLHKADTSCVSAKGSPSPARTLLL